MSAWRPVKNYEERYEVSRHGRVRHTNGPEIGQWKAHNGYMLVRLSKPRAQFMVHRLVAQVFCSNPGNKPNVNHLDHNRAHNKASNLEWCTQQENLSHARANGRISYDYLFGKRSPNALLQDETVREIRILYAGGNWSWERLGKHFGISKRAIGRLLTGETYADV